MKNLNILETVSLLHDIGKIGIPDKILHKSGPLNDEEYALIKLHPEKGEHMLKDISLLVTIIPSILYHHERFDGNGYPGNLRQYDIPFTSRIIAVADSIDAMTSDRSYRKAMNHGDAVKELKKGVNTQFDPVMVDVIVKIYESGELADLYSKLDV
ncbi:MAG: HD domain-containing protein [Spirochaetales bacterium]|nr:HD domain-containing protein [Spirochaetales bacterium]